MNGYDAPIKSVQVKIIINKMSVMAWAISFSRRGAGIYFNYESDLVSRTNCIICCVQVCNVPTNTDT